MFLIRSIIYPLKPAQTLYLKSTVILTNIANITGMEPSVLIKDLLVQIFFLVIALEAAVTLHEDLTSSHNLDGGGLTIVANGMFRIFIAVSLLRNIGQLMHPQHRSMHIHE